MLKRSLFILALFTILLAACTPTPTPTLQPTATSTQSPTEPQAATAVPATSTAVPSATTAPSATPRLPTATATITATPTPDLSIPATGYGPTGFPKGVNPLTGLRPAQASMLNRRPIVIKVENIPRQDRPQWGLTLADIVFEYYTEQGGTRFAAVYYGQEAEKVGPIRSARFFDFNVVQMYKSVFVFGYAYADLFSAIMSSNFSNRLLLEGYGSSPALTRFEPNGVNFLLANTLELPNVLKAKKIDNTLQNLDGMFFNTKPPAADKPATQIFVRYSGSIYNRWDYDPASGRYLRFADAADDVNRNNEKYAQLTDRLTGKPVAADNLVILQVEHKYVKKTADTEVFDMKLIGEGKAFIARDGQMYEVKWKRAKSTDVLTLVNKDGTLFPFKPGQTWFEVLANNSTLTDLKSGSWKFTWLLP
jgi:hypothetical protein